MDRVYSGCAEYVNLRTFDRLTDLLLFGGIRVLPDPTERQMGGEGTFFRFVSQPA